MANNTFSDFSALKSLKKELEKQDESKNPVKCPLVLLESLW